MSTNSTGIPLFPAPLFTRCPLDVSAHLAKTGKHWTYAGSGRACLYQILKKSKSGTRIAVPAYICRSVLAPITKLGLTPVYYDIDAEDLNPSVVMLSQLIARGNIGAALFPSLYGLPANCVAAQTTCRASGVMMIDDAAQSYGASLNGKAIGTFGDAGFISFSPGKATAAHGGGLYWTLNSSPVPKQRFALSHPLLLWAFLHSRLAGAERSPLHGPASLLFSILKRNPGWNAASSIADLEILGGVLQALGDGVFAFRHEWFARAEQLASQWKGVRLVRRIRGEAHPHKIVIVAETPKRARAISQAMIAACIRHGRGYSALSTGDLPNATALVGRVLELPIVQDHIRMSRMLDILTQI